MLAARLVPPATAPGDAVVPNAGGAAVPHGCPASAGLPGRAAW